MTTSTIKRIKCLECDELALWRVWYRGCTLEIAGTNIAYNSLCGDCAARELKDGRDGWLVACIRAIEIEK